MTMVEYRELKTHYDEHVKRWAISRASFNNAHFRGPDDPLWIWQDFLGTSDRPQRKQAHMREKYEVAKMNMKLSRMRRGDDESGMPAWARGQYRGRR